MAKIMLCDDSPTILTLLGKKLSDAGHEIVGKAKDGEEGIELYAKTKPDLAILDITMPNKDGRECLQGILSLNPRAKVVMVSALKEDAVVSECISQGAKAFIPKSKIYAGSDEFQADVLAVIEGVLQGA